MVARTCRTRSGRAFTVSFFFVSSRPVPAAARRRPCHLRCTVDAPRAAGPLAVETLSQACGEVRGLGGLRLIPRPAPGRWPRPRPWPPAVKPGARGRRYSADAVAAPAGAQLGRAWPARALESNPAGGRVAVTNIRGKDAPALHGPPRSDPSRPSSSARTARRAGGLHHLRRGTRRDPRRRN